MEMRKCRLTAIFVFFSHLQRNYELRIEMRYTFDRREVEDYVEYQNFRIGSEAEKYVAVQQLLLFLLNTILFTSITLFLRARWTASFYLNTYDGLDYLLFLNIQDALLNLLLLFLNIQDGLLTFL